MYKGENKMNLCECGSEVFITVDRNGRWYAICKDCDAVFPLIANNRLDAIKEWNEISVQWN